MTTPGRTDWATYFTAIAHAVAARSDCRRASVGAVIVDTGNRIVSTGYVGTQAGQPGCLDGACPRGLLSADQCAPGSQYDNCISTHAEANALLYSDRRRHNGGTIYITRAPCYTCLKLLRSSGLATAVFTTDTPNHLDRTDLVPTPVRCDRD
jgi:dCMP deaminase